MLSPRVTHSKFSKNSVKSEVGNDSVIDGLNFAYTDGDNVG